MTVVTDTFEEMDAPGMPVRVFEPIQLELSDHTVLQVVRVDHRISSQLGDVLINVDAPPAIEGRPLVDHARKAFDTAKAAVGAVTDQLDWRDTATITIDIQCGVHTTTINCTANA